ncbi:MAG: hypothetical protein ACJ8F3_21110 [Xanthobacteraceae bacterium]
MSKRKAGRRGAIPLRVSLSKARGLSDQKVEEGQRFLELEQLMTALRLSDGSARLIPRLARELYETNQEARVAVLQKRKQRILSRHSLERELRSIEKGANTLATRLKRAHTNVVQAWLVAAAGEGVERSEAMQEWLQLKRLLGIAADRARQIPPPSRREVKTPAAEPGRPPDVVGDAVAIAAANAYELLTGRVAVRSFERDKNNPKPVGAFHNFMTAVFDVLEIGSSPDACNMRLQAQLSPAKALKK